MFDDAVQAAIAATEDRRNGCPDDPQLAQIWRDRRDGREWHPDPFIGAALECVETGRQYCSDPILAAALEATRHLPDSGPPPAELEPAHVAERPEAVGGGDPYGEGRAMQAAHERSSWINSGAFQYADTLRVREFGSNHG